MTGLQTTRPDFERQYVGVQEASQITGLSPWTWRQWAYTGKVASVKAGKGQRARLLIPIAEVHRVMSEGLRPRLEEVQ